MAWLVFSYSLPAKSQSSPRVALWRRLRRLGAVPLTGGYILPSRWDCLEAFSWLAQEVRGSKGEAVVMRVEHFEGLTDADVIERFHKARQEDYEELGVQLAQLEEALKDESEQPCAPDTFLKLKRRLGDMRRIDFFSSPAGAQAAAHVARLEQRLAPAEHGSPEVFKVKLEDYKDKPWVTRPQPHVDRLACIWLIRRFIDRRARIRYAHTPRDGEISFDMPGSHFGHLGNLCSFEVMILAFGLQDLGTAMLASLVHDIDLRDGRHFLPETAGIDAILAGWLAMGLDDGDLESRGTTLFEGLYETFSTRGKL